MENIVISALQWAQVGMDLYSMVSQYADRNCTTVEQLTRNVLAGVASFAVGFTVGAIIGTAGVLAFGPGLLAAVFVGAVGSVVAGQWARAVSNLILGKPWDDGLMKREDILTDFAFGIFGEVIGFGFAKLIKTVKALRIAGGSVDDIIEGGITGRLKPGPKPQGTGLHNKKIVEIAALVTDGEIIAGGQMLPEKLIQTPGGIKTGRRPDILVLRFKDGSIYGINIGKTTKSGALIKREIEAIYDLEDAGIEMFFVKYQ